MALIDDFKARFPEFTPATVDTAWAGLEASWPCHYNFGYGLSDCSNETILQLIAHLFVLATSGGNGPSQAVSAQSVGSVSQTFSVPQNVSTQSSFYNSTKYGQQFAILIASRVGAFFV
jgi:hypothetical protein